MYDRQLLLSEAKRNAILELWEVQRFGRDSFENPNHVSLYGQRPAAWYAKGVRVLGRTAVECTPDRLAQAIGRDIAEIVKQVPPEKEVLVIDLFAGSGNTLYWILRHLPDAEGIGLELDERIVGFTRRNIQALGLSLEIRNIDFASGLKEMAVHPVVSVIAFVAPPWGRAVDRALVLDLRRTTPPIAEIIDTLESRFERNPLLCAVQVLENVESVSLAEVRARFDWSAMRSYKLNKRGPNPGLLLGRRRWGDPAAAARQ